MSSCEISMHTILLQSHYQLPLWESWSHQSRWPVCMMLCSTMIIICQRKQRWSLMTHKYKILKLSMRCKQVRMNGYYLANAHYFHWHKHNFLSYMGVIQSQWLIIPCNNGALFLIMLVPLNSTWIVKFSGWYHLPFSSKPRLFCPLLFILPCAIFDVVSLLCYRNHFLSRGKSGADKVWHIKYTCHMSVSLCWMQCYEQITRLKSRKVLQEYICVIGAAMGDKGKEWSLPFIISIQPNALKPNLKCEAV